MKKQTINIWELNPCDTISEKELNGIARRGHLIYIDGIYYNWNNLKNAKGIFSVVSISERSALVNNLNVSSNNIFTH